MLRLSMIISVIVCFGIPITGIILLKKKGVLVGRTVLMGALAFFISQICIRLPILTALGQTAWYAGLQYNQTVFGLFLGVTAGLAEETARWIFMRFLVKQRWELGDGLAFGLGHGGIEAILLVGINMLLTFFISFGNPAITTGLTTAGILGGAMERIFAMAFHVGASLLVMYGLRSGKSLRYLFAAILIHTVLDAGIVILPAWFGTGIIGIEIWNTCIGTLTLVLGTMVYIKYRPNKVENR